MKTKVRGACNNQKKNKGEVSIKRLPGGGRKLTDQHLEEKVLNWIHERRENML